MSSTSSTHALNAALRVWLLLTGLVVCGCGTVGVEQQRLVSKPNMQFSQSAVYRYSSKIMPQIQPGLAASGGALPSSCTACR
ncbi:MAG TPA: hypothetical protein VGK40_08210 [Verrucomicrobiae bacterium]